MTTKIRETPAKTFAGLAVKVRALRFDTHLNTQYDLRPEAQDWPEYVMNEFVAEIDRLSSREIAPLREEIEMMPSGLGLINRIK